MSFPQHNISRPRYNIMSPEVNMTLPRINISGYTLKNAGLFFNPNAGLRPLGKGAGLF